jgi:hypothetical protein
MPVEDTTVEWSEDDSPFLPVARLEMPASVEPVKTAETAVTQPGK